MEQGIEELKEQSSSASEGSRQRHLTTSSSATDDMPPFSPPTSEPGELREVITHDSNSQKETTVSIVSTPEKVYTLDSSTGVKIPNIELSPSIATQTVMTGNDVEEHKSRTPPRPSPARDSLDGSRPLVERMPSVITGECGTPPRAPVVKLDTKFSDTAEDTTKQRRRFKRKKYGSPARSPGRSPVRFESKDSGKSSTRGLVKPKALKAMDESKNDSPTHGKFTFVSLGEYQVLNLQ